MQPRDLLAEHQRMYELSDVVHRYAKREDLLAAEQTIFARLQPQLSSLRLLDLGVGAGRTTLHLASVTREYLGIDCSAAMVAACQRRFGDPAPGGPGARFAIGDARRLDGVGDRSFDLVLFSYNGIDCVSHDDRMQILREAKRVLVPGGLLCFSSHNLRSLLWSPLLTMSLFRQRKGPLGLLADVWDCVSETYSLLRANQDLLQKLRRPFALIQNERGEEVYHVTVEEQLRQLRAAGFEEVEVFSTLSGTQLHNAAAQQALAEPWIYYLCRAAPDN